MPKMTSPNDQGQHVNPGGAMQTLVPASVHGLPATIAAGNHATSNLILSDGLQIGAVGVTSTQTGLISVQRYLDDAGTIKQGAALTQALTANTAAVLNITDGNPFASFTVDISNTGGSQATLSNLGILLQGK
ncbi:hypothetical protein OJF2_50960 [Aquisphaera giovannonii]|uniref:Uncharacterized protein n=1 Tax=Aquisphaera giovannonii TaxID=406548 RepID=A0A5B9W757_9BACT|nr:hypothetical protein [Aquisphaera giovannonii]QEH36512.1 hypothetical protein OJF2_50960 [Aquisphaera giovannonii]